MQRTRTVRRFNYKKAVFMIYLLAMPAFSITNAAAKFMFLWGRW